MSQWGYFTWFPEHGSHLVHPEDIGWFGDAGVQGAVGMVAPGPDSWLVFHLGKKTVRLASEIVHPCASPDFRHGQRVETLPPRTPFTGEITSIKWHFERHEPFYLVGPKHSRYYSHELRAA